MDRCLLAPNLLLDKILLSILHFEGGKRVKSSKNADIPLENKSLFSEMK